MKYSEIVSVEKHLSQLLILPRIVEKRGKHLYQMRDLKIICLK